MQETLPKLRIAQECQYVVLAREERLGRGVLRLVEHRDEHGRASASARSSVVLPDPLRPARTVQPA